MDLRYYNVSTPIGSLTIVEYKNIVVYIGLPDSSKEKINNWCKKKLNYNTFKKYKNPQSLAKTQLEEYFFAQRKVFTFKYQLFTTDFRKKVLTAVTKIPFGQTKSYGEIAKNIGHPKAMRAVGTANATNTLPIVIPCHRVIAQNGGLGGYGGGLDMKIKLLELEEWI